MDSSAFQGVVPGMTIKIHQKIKELNPKGEEKERVQAFEGMVLQRRGGSSSSATITVRKISHGIGVEKIFPIHLPSITKVEKLKAASVRRAKLFYTRTSKKKMRETTIA